MQLPIVAPAPMVAVHAQAFRDLFENRRQFRHFQNYLTALIVTASIVLHIELERFIRLFDEHGMTTLLIPLP